MFRRNHSMRVYLITVLTVGICTTWLAGQTAIPSNAAPGAVAPPVVPAPAAAPEASSAPATAAEPAKPAVSGEAYPYLGTIKADDVYIRSGPGEIWYPSGKFEKGQEVMVEGEKFGWLKIAPTKQCFCFIAKEFVKVDPANASKIGQPQEKVPGEVIGNQVRVRAGSIRVPADKASEVLTKLNTGAAVQIIGQEGDFYKIIPPEGAYFWVLSQFVNRSGPVSTEAKAKLESEAGQAAASTPAAQEPIGEQNAGSAATPDADETAIQIGKDRQAYLDAANAYKKEVAKPIDQRNFAPIRERVKALVATTKSTSVKSSAEKLQIYLDNAEMASSLIQKSKAADAQLNATVATIDKDLAELAASFQPLKKEKVLVQGTISESAVFTTPGKDQRFLVLDDQQQIIYYAVSASDSINLKDWVNKRVSMQGFDQYDAFGRVRIIFVDAIEDLSKPK